MAGVDYDERVPEAGETKANLDKYLCGQCPRYEDADIDLVQSGAILRYLGRKYNLYGSSVKEKAYIDIVLDSVYALSTKYLPPIYFSESEEAKAASTEEYWQKHGDPAGANADWISGAHLAFINNMLKKFGGDGPYLLGSTLSIADMVIFAMVDSHVVCLGLGERLSLAYPALMEHHAAVGALPAVAKFIESEARHAK